MAKAASGAKSQAIQEYLSTNPGANAQTIVDDLKQKGIEVSLGLAKVVKYGKKGEKVSAKRAGMGRMMKRKAISGSEFIRQFIAKHPGSMAKEIRQGLRQQGVKVSLGLISNVKYSSGKKKTSRKRPIRSATVHVAARKTRKAALTIDQLLEVKKFADSIGGADKIRLALDTLAELQ
jgi:hypothetical protein